MSHHITKMMIVMSIFFALCTAAYASDSTEVATEQAPVDPNAYDETHYVMSAYPSSNVSVRGSLGLSLTLLPQPLTEYPTAAPMADVRLKFAFPLGINGTMRLASNIATSLAQGGGFWGVNIGRLSVGAGYSVAFVYGNLTYVDGFRTTQQRWINYPMVTASWSFPGAALTAKLEAEYTTAVESTIEDQPTKSTKNTLTGGALTVSIEQPFFKTTHVIIGVTFQYSSDPYQAWFLYNQFKDRLFSSEFFVGFIL
ncbi:MAG: hypothetical protein HQ472_04870 [Ignavibacteria bacterium]|nr:hypothetical protein [Ignavibacteria bacterium]